MEVELQYVFDGAGHLVVPVSLAGLRLRAASTVDLVDTYYDTHARDLRRAGCTLRIRRSDHGPPELVWKGPSRRRPEGAKEREEMRIMTPGPLLEWWALEDVLRHAGLQGRLDDLCDGAGGTLHPVGELKRRRSSHEYSRGADRLELSWDQLEYPIGPPETRLELQAFSERASTFLDQADSELRSIFGKHLRPASMGKAHELYERLQADLFAA